MDLLQPAGATLGLDPDEIDARYDQRFADLNDDDLFELTARVVAVPKRDAATSFILHAPLELLARRSLLELASAPSRGAIRARMLWVAATYERAAEAAEPVPVRAFDSISEARLALVTAITDGDLDGVEAIAPWFTAHASTDDVVRLAPVLIDSLAAAGHASIYFSLLPRVAARNRSALALLRPLVREVARMPEWRVEWIRDRVQTTSADADQFAGALATTPRLGLPGNDFIFPIVHQVDGSGIARRVIEPALPGSVNEATYAILRVAAMSMLQDDATFAPYGWTHCLTLPQAVCNITSMLTKPEVGLAIAATYVVGFRAAEGAREVALHVEPERLQPGRAALDVIDALDAPPSVAAAAAYHASDADAARLVPELAARSGAHEDAHVAKYTLACFDASRRDHAYARLYLAAAAYLWSWWQHRPPDASD